MARTREQWNTDINAWAANAGLSSSAVANWKLLRDLVVSIAMTLESIIDAFKADIDTELSTKQPGTLRWYAFIAKQYQYGYSLSLANGIVLYSTIDTAAQIITQASVREDLGNIIVIKVAKSDGSGGLKHLDYGAELPDFKNYMQSRGIPGVLMNIYSYDADTVNVTATVSYDPLYDPAIVQANITAALGAFRDSFPFDAQFYYSQMMKTIMDVDGVVDVSYLNLDMLMSNGIEYPHMNTHVEMPAGYFIYGTNLITLNAAS